MEALLGRRSPRDSDETDWLVGKPNVHKRINDD